MKGLKAFLSIRFLPYLNWDEIFYLISLKLQKETDFFYNGTKLQYFFHSYNNFYVTERKIEIPIIGEYLQRLKPSNVLEIGNVSSHYYDFFGTIFNEKIDIVDKYEKGFNVINIDIANYSTNKKYDFIFSISTFEHMDDDYEQIHGLNIDKERCIAVKNMEYVIQNLLLEGGTFIVTFPFGQSPKLDHFFKSRKIEKIACKKICNAVMIRDQNYNWKQVVFKNLDYLDPVDEKGAKSLIVLEFSK